MNSDQIQSIIRSILTTAGAGLVTSGAINNGQLNEIIGAVLALGSVAWSLWQKRESAKLTKAVTVVNSALASGDASHAESTAAGAKIVVAN